MLAASLGCEHVLLVQLRVVRLKADITRIRHMLVIKYNHHISPPIQKHLDLIHHFLTLVPSALMS